MLAAPSMPLALATHRGHDRALASSEALLERHTNVHAATSRDVLTCRRHAVVIIRHRSFLSGIRGYLTTYRIKCLLAVWPTLGLLRPTRGVMVRASRSWPAPAAGSVTFLHVPYGIGFG